MPLRSAYPIFNAIQWYTFFFPLRWVIKNTPFICCRSPFCCLWKLVLAAPVNKFAHPCSTCSQGPLGIIRAICYSPPSDRQPQFNLQSTNRAEHSGISSINVTDAVQNAMALAALAILHWPRGPTDNAGQVWSAGQSLTPMLHTNRQSCSLFFFNNKK